MGAYVLRRLLLLVPTLFAIMLVNFAVVQIVPGGPVGRAEHPALHQLARARLHRLCADQVNFFHFAGKVVANQGKIRRICVVIAQIVGNKHVQVDVRPGGQATFFPAVNIGAQHL